MTRTQTIFQKHICEDDHCKNWQPHCLECGYPREEQMSSKCNRCVNEMWDDILGHLSRKTQSEFIQKYYIEVQK